MLSALSFRKLELVFSCFVSFSMLVLHVDVANASTPNCKAYPGSHDWPAEEAWASLDKRLGEGRLLQPPPPGAVCHPGQPTYDPRECEAVTIGWTSYDFHVSDPVSVMCNNFNNDTCLPDPSYPCSPDGYPVYVVNASKAEHVKEAIDFARHHNVRINVKNTGHDFLGRSNAPGSLSVWTHNLKSIEYHQDQFKLDNCDIVIDGDAITVGGGVEVYEAYLAAAQYNHTIVGGTGKSVGVAGYSSGGGHSILSSNHGLAADNVLQMQVVTPSGDILTVNEARDADLFWALRGGGGSTFGIVTSITFKAIPSPTIATINFALPIPKSPAFWDVVVFVLSQLADLGDDYGLSGNFYAASVPFPDVSEKTGMLGTAILQNHDHDTLDSVSERILAMNETLKQRWPNVTAIYPDEVVKYDSFLDWFEQRYDKGTAGHSVFLGSRLVGKDLMTNGNEESLARAFESATGELGLLQAFLVAGKGTAEAEPRGGSNAVHPAWRKAYYHTLAGKGFPPFNKTAEMEAREALIKEWQPMRELTPDGGSYVNEAFKYDSEFQNAFWGSNYGRLLAIKKEVDPTDVFWCQPCVGNEGWEETRDGLLCKIEEVEEIEDL